MRYRLLVAIWAILAIAPFARADYVSRSYQFDLSNALPTGESFGSVKVEAYNGVGSAGGGLSAGQVRLTFQASPLAQYGPLDPTFGFQQLGFNSNLSFDNAQISVPTGYQIRNDRFMGGFGLFHWQAYSTTGAVDPLAITISGLGADATVDNFLVGSKSSTGDWPLFGSVFFAGRIGGFDINNDFFDLTNHDVGASAVSLPDEGGLGGGLDGSGDPVSATPEPSALVLGLFGVGAFFGVRRVRGRRS